MSATPPFSKPGVVRFNPAGMPFIDGAAQPVTSAAFPTYECPLCGLKGLLAAALCHHVCPAVSDAGIAGLRGGPLPRHVIQAVLDGDVASIQEHAMPKA